jgi:hypothetical protein
MILSPSLPFPFRPDEEVDLRGDLGRWEVENERSEVRADELDEAC